MIINLMMGLMSFGVTNVLSKGIKVSWSGFSGGVDRAISSGVSDLQQGRGFAGEMIVK